MEEYKQQQIEGLASFSPSGKSTDAQNSPSKSRRIYLNYKSKDLIFAETSPQNTNLYEKSKRDRQQMEKLNQIMLNRVQLLQQQDEKLNKKINEQKNYATSISSKKSRIEQEKLEKQKRKQEADQELLMKKQHIQQMKQEQKSKKEQVKQAIFEQKCYETKLIKKQTIENQNQIDQFNKEYEINNQMKKMSIQQEYAEGNQKIKEFYSKKKQEVQQQIQNMVEMEVGQRRALEEQFKLLEQEEFQQLQKLKSTKEAEKNAVNQLETVKASTPNAKQQNSNQKYENSPNSNGEFTDPTLITNQVLLEEQKDEESNQKQNEINQ